MNRQIKPVGVAIVGCGVISQIYAKNLSSRFSIIKLIGCCDQKEELAAAMADEYHIRQMTMEEILAVPEIELVVNLTTPNAHYSVIKQLLENGKHVYTEKVLAPNRQQAAELVRLADQKHLQLCAAPDTFLGAAAQTARFAVESGLIGEVTSCVAALQRDGALLAERFPYTALPGGGIGIDVGIYYATELLSILGPATVVSGMAGTYQPRRKHLFLSKGQFGEEYTMEAETYLAGTVQFACGAIGSLHFNSASIRCEKPHVVLYGTKGILYLPDPNFFGGEVKLLAKGQTEPYVLPHTHAYHGDDRGVGVADMAWAMRLGRTPRANKELAYHALELLTGVVESGEMGRQYQMQSSFTLQPGLPRGYFDAEYGMSEPEAAFALEE